MCVCVTNGNLFVQLAINSTRCQCEGVKTNEFISESMHTKLFRQFENVSDFEKKLGNGIDYSTTHRNETKWPDKRTQREEICRNIAHEREQALTDDSRGKLKSRQA